MPKMSQSELENLIEIYRDARDQLIKTITGDTGVGTKVYYNTILKQLEAQLKRLEKQSAYYVQSEIPKEYQNALDELYAYFQKNNLQMKAPTVFAQVHKDAVYAIAKEMQYHIGQGLSQVGRQVERYLGDARDDALRQAGLRATGQKIASGSTVRDMQKNLIKRLQNEGFMTVQYGSGKGAYQVGIDSYAAMVARSTTREAGNIARENQLVENGYDLVKMTSHYPTCEVCAMYQGRVYSISGKDKRFPALYETAFKSGYRNVHPNCRHSIHAWIESMQSPEELQEALDKAKQTLEDNRSDEEKALYSQQQAQNRRMRQDRYQYERYKMRLGDDAPKSFHAFRKMKKANKEDWKQMQSDYRTVSKLSENKNAGDYAVNSTVITSDKYKDKFTSISSKSKVNNAVARETRRCISLNVNKNTENYALIDVSNGETVQKERLGAFGGAVKIPSNSKGLILTHNHPKSTSFSYDDIDTLVGVPSIKTIVAGGHNGKVYMLSIKNGKRLDKSVITEYNVLMEAFDKDTHKTVSALAEKYNWEYEVK